MMYDDIANNKLNPYPGKLFNEPDGEDLYKGLKIDYKKSSVTPQNFLNILKGNATGVRGGNGRVIESNPNDRIFVYFTDHGAVGMISFPEDMITVKQLNNALNWMYRNDRYNQLVFYLESCESGSMFEDVLKSSISVYAVTAANAHESSWGTYCTNDMHLPCLGDLFSINWMKNSDKEHINDETLEDQYDKVKRVTNLSHVMHFGDLDIAKEPVGWFQGMGNPRRKYVAKEPHRADSWPSRDVELSYLYQLKHTTNDVTVIKKLNQRIREIQKDRHRIKSLFFKLVNKLITDPNDRQRMVQQHKSVEDIDCHDEVIRMFDLLCIDLNKYDYALKYVYVLNNLCIELGNTEEIVNAMWKTC
ncbi:peptidase C13 family protein [Dictyocaulus viviparus]|uniref:legumain n=1 Tax=Dictyocaulus viviparus TaxID=29172 RepID=A0A0D8Y425_DICVI|nr:peptidase C13 family protein [Dictyocaulus viviparus]